MRRALPPNSGIHAFGFVVLVDGAARPDLRYSFFALLIKNVILHLVALFLRVGISVDTVLLLVVPTARFFRVKVHP